MQNKYSLAYAAAKDGQAVVGKDAAMVNSGALAPERLGETAPIHPRSVALTNASLQLSGLSLSLGLLRSSVDGLRASVSRLEAVDVNPSRTDRQIEPSSATAFKSSKVDDRRLTREALTVRNMERLDPVTAFQQANASFAFGSKRPPEKSITVLREESTKSTERLTKTLEPVPVLGEATWLRAKTGVLDTVNNWASDSPVAAESLKTAETVMSSVVSPVVSEFFSGVGETIKERVTGNLVDMTLGKLPGVGTLFKDGGYDKEKDKGQGCCCPDESQSGSTRPSIILPPGYERERGQSTSGKAPGKGSGKKGGRLGNWLRDASDRLGKAMLPTPPALHAAQAPPLPQASTSRLAGTMTRLESVGARRLGPMRYVDTAMDVVEGVRNGDAKAVGAGLSAAGGAWAGASAGAAIGTMIFPGVGTAVGGAIGGLLGSEAGSWLGDKLLGSSDRLPAPADVSKRLDNAQADNRQVTFAPQITINATEQASYQQLAELVVQQIEAQFSPLSMSDLLGSRRDSALTDIGGV
ncbi:hypothetical protein [Pseudomonas extremorientalis]|uniref:Phage tail tape measure protein n=1 Tax=Pseudomonas extremorientalis TaxID=169669 RepID=A0A1H0VDZ1_9PSED|nr:hypothetical protein [Pseudomonas extremorientalis]OIN11447.1 hypothetical protein BFN10_04955 [Pseudomonas extremorientalis]SDP76561.1 hypothetical protein SAMN04490184_4760 [Pseudomonas extremorientalis]